MWLAIASTYLKQFGEYLLKQKQTSSKKMSSYSNFCMDDKETFKRVSVEK